MTLGNIYHQDVNPTIPDWTCVECGKELERHRGRMRKYCRDCHPGGRARNDYVPIVDKHDGKQHKWRKPK